MNDIIFVELLKTLKINKNSVYEKGTTAQVIKQDKDKALLFFPDAQEWFVDPKWVKQVR